MNMQFIYKLFVSDKELLGSLPIFGRFQSRAKAEEFIKFMRKNLFLRKAKNFFYITSNLKQGKKAKK